MKLRAGIGGGIAALLLSTATSRPARALDVPNVGGETLSLDISNTSSFGYHFDNRNDKPVDPAAPNLNAADHVDDNYFEWFNRLYLRGNWGKLSLGVRLDSAVFSAMSRQDAQALIAEQIPGGKLANDTSFGRELNNRYRDLIYPAKLWVQLRHDWVEATVGDFYAHLGRGLVFSVRKLDEIGVDTTVRGGKLLLKTKLDSLRIDGTVFGGQLNPLRLDFATGRVLSGTGSPLFFLFPGVGGASVPRVADFQYFADNTAGGDPEFVRRTDRAKPSYLEDNVVGASVLLGTSRVKLGLNGVMVLRQGNSEDQQRCVAAAQSDVAFDECQARFPSFSHTETSRAHDQIRSASASLTVPPIAGVVDGYVEAAFQNQVDGQVASIGKDAQNPALEVVNREPDITGYAVYANVNVVKGPVGLTLEGKHYRSFFAIGANIDQGTQLGFAAPEYSIVAYNRPPTVESIYTEPIGNPDVCNTGGRARLDVTMGPRLKVYGWLGRSTSFTELDDKNIHCATGDDKRTDTWDTAAGTEIDAPDGKSHYWGWLGARFTDRPVASPLNPELHDATSVFYREGYVRYDLDHHVAGDFSVSALGYHRRRFEPLALAEVWHEGENLLALNWAPHFAFIFGYEYQTRPGFPTHYFNGAVQYKSQRKDAWYHQLTEQVRLWVGQRRAALRCVGGVCRVYPAFEGALLEVVSRF